MPAGPAVAPHGCRKRLKGMFRRDTIEANESFDDAVHTAMTVIKGDGAMVRKFFEHPEVAYVRKALKC